MASCQFPPGKTYPVIYGTVRYWVHPLPLQFRVQDRILTCRRAARMCFATGGDLWVSTVTYSSCGGSEFPGINDSVPPCVTRTPERCAIAIFVCCIL